MVTIELSKKHAYWLAECIGNELRGCWGLEDELDYMDALWALRDEINAKLVGYVPEEEE